MARRLLTAALLIFFVPWAFLPPSASAAAGDHRRGVAPGHQRIARRIDLRHHRPSGCSAWPGGICASLSPNPLGGQTPDLGADAQPGLPARLPVSSCPGAAAASASNPPASPLSVT